MAARSLFARLACFGFAFLLASCALLPAAGPTTGPTAPPTLAPTLSPTPRPTATATSRPSPLPTATATPEPTATPFPLGDRTLLDQAAAALADGDLAGAAGLFLRVRAEQPNSALADEALLGLARTYVEMGQPLSTTALLGPTLDALPDGARQRAFFWMGEAWNAVGDCSQAEAFFQAYIAGGTTVADLLAERLAWCYRARGDSARAAAAFTQAAGPQRSASDQVTMLEEAAVDLRAVGDYEAALSRYRSILAIAEKRWYRATILFKMGQTAQEAGRPEEAQSYWQEALASYPDTEAASWAADALLQAAVPVDPYHVAQAYTAAGRPDAALPYFDAALAAITPTAEMRYAAAAAHAAAGDLDGALLQLGALVLNNPADPQPLLEQGRYLGQYGAVSRALEVYRLIIAGFPQDIAAGEARWRAGQLLEGQGHVEEAIAEYIALRQDFPSHDRAAAARYRAGLLRYRQGAYAAAAALWEGDDTPRIALWRGLALSRAGQMEAARAAWSVAAAGRGYYADRSRELLSPDGGFGTWRSSPTWPADEARDEAEEWLAQRLGQAVSSDLPSAVRQDPLLQRGEELLALGRPGEARRPFLLLADRYRYDGPALYALAIYFRDRAFYYPSILCAERLLRAAGAEESDAPAFLLYLLYPMPYAHLIVPAALEEGIDPFIFFSLVRQESRFDRYATSWAEARGLTQVIPSTGEGIAAALGFSPFRLEDLYRPVVSVRFGTWYLGRQLAAFDGQALVALAAYNGGPGNAQRWANRTVPVSDLDLFVEAIDYEETRDYIERIYTSYWVYRRLYGAAPER